MNTEELQSEKIRAWLDERSRPTSEEGTDGAPDFDDPDCPVTEEQWMAEVALAYERQRQSAIVQDVLSRDVRPRRRSPTYGHAGQRVYTKPLTCKVFHVVIPRPMKPEAVLDLFWSHFGNHPDRSVPSTNKVVTAGEVREGDVHLVVEYTVRGGHPSDFRKWVGSLLRGDHTQGADVEATLKETLYPDAEGALRTKDGTFVRMGNAAIKAEQHTSED